VIERFYTPLPLSSHVSVPLDETERHHARVLRLDVGDEVELINGHGTLALANITSVSQKATILQVSHFTHTPPPEIQIHSVIPVMRPSKLEWVIEKGTEIGADAFHIYTANFSEKDSLSPHQLDRLRAITISALKQSRRLYLPSISLYNHLSLILEKEALFLFGDPQGTLKISPPTQSVFFITGPEKGFSQEEQDLLIKQAQGIRLNKNVLRAETAPLVALTLLCQ
jgi:16S rRNA (uracil1498-N3)-methyltransferase